MNTAFAAACKSLQLVIRDDPMTEIVARKIIDVARAGERDPQRMHDLALARIERNRIVGGAKLNQALVWNVRTWPAMRGT